MIEVFFTSLDLLHDAIIRSLPHPLLGGIPSGPS